ncbi:MAG: serine kinase [Synergistales bacterium]|nr:serine kinase [Synergistales bacterium]
MKINTLLSKFTFQVFSKGDQQRELTGVVIADLLSFVMGQANPGEVWLTVQNHLNVAAVAVLKEIPMIILPSGRIPSTDLIQRCIAENITLCSSSRTSYDICIMINEVGFDR